MRLFLNKIPWILFFLLFFLSIFYFFHQPVQLAGDIAEYYGITESVLSHGSINLTPSDQQILSSTLHPVYFTNPGYYLTGRNFSRFPVHFIFYSFLVIPFRLILRLFGQNELLSLTFTNIALIFSAIYFNFRHFVKNTFSRLILLITFISSPLISFISWPGPDIFYCLLVLISIFLFNKKKYLSASIITAVASWHGQPLIILSIFYGLIYFLNTNLVSTDQHHWHLNFKLKTLIAGLTVFFIFIIPYLYNLYAFSVLTPWTIFKDGWTQISGFGIKNISLRRTFEQFFDLNMGIFWYAPLIIIIGFYHWLESKKTNQLLFFPVILTTLFYQTNPGWNFGTAGYGPSRHIIFIIPFFIYFLTTSIKPKIKNYFLLTIIIISQFFILSQNGLFTPDFTKSLFHTPWAEYIINRLPQIYHPTPEIFTDRTNHTDSGYPATAIYKKDGVCRQAYVLTTDKNKLISECGYIPNQFIDKFNDEFLNQASFPRITITTEATFLPDDQSCQDDHQTTKDNPFICLKTLSDFIKNTSIDDPSRIESLPSIGSWHLKNGLPQKIIVPPGYIIHYTSLSGIYVDY